MRLYTTLEEAMSEIQRDLYKGPKITSTRVQQRVDQELPGRELLGYSYTIEAGGIPREPEELQKLGLKLGLKPFSGELFLPWLRHEFGARRSGSLNVSLETWHPALQSTLEGKWPAYTYGERLHGAVDALVEALEASGDSRRAYWPIFEQHDSLRAAAPTRIPCSLGYQVLIRNTTVGPRLVLVYLQRSADFDTFFMTDIWFANQFQKLVAQRVDVKPGQFIHFITSLHSFEIEGTEVY